MESIETATQEASDQKSTDQVIRASEQYVRESEEARRNRLEVNKMNWDVYHLNQDFGHKRPGQSREVLPKQSMAVEQITEFFQQGLMDIDDWWRCDYKPGVDEKTMPIKREEIKKIVDHYLDKLNNGDGFLPFVGDQVKCGLLGSVMITKVHGGLEKKPFYTFEQRPRAPESAKDRIAQTIGLVKPQLDPVLKRGFRQEWQLQLDIVMPYEYGIDPSGRKLYEYQEVYLDWSDAENLAKGPDKIYDMSVLNECGKEIEEDWEHKVEAARQTGQTISYEGRKKVKIQEFWGTIVDIKTGEVLYENVVWTIANDRFLLQKPTPNPFWHGRSPFVATPIIRVPKSEWHKSLMDAPTRQNIALNELYNLILDSGLMAAYGLKQYRPDYMANESDAAEGFSAGQSVAVTADCPPGMKVIERVDTGSVSQESLAVYQLTNAEFNQAALTNDLRMGVLPNRAVKATEVVESSNSINSVFTGLSKVLEVAFIAKVLELSWMTCLQNANSFSSDEMRALLGDQRALEIAALSPQERYAKCIHGVSFNVFGVSKTLAKLKDFKKLVSLLQTISGSPILMGEFTSEYSMPKLLQQIMVSLDINTDQLQMSPEEKIQAQMRLQQSMQLEMQKNAGGNVPDNQSQIPQATTGPSRETTESFAAQGRNS